MKKVTDFIIKHYKLILILFTVLTILAGIMTTGVKINYSIQGYLPDDSETVLALDKMKEEFREPLPNLRVVLKNKTVPEVFEYKEKLQELDDVKLVLWLDTMENPYTPMQLIDEDQRNMYYKDGNALFDVAVESSNSKNALDEIKSTLPEDTAYGGALVEEAAAQNSVSNEVTQITIFAVPAALLILVLTVSSWIEPLLLLLSIVVAVILNMGTNVFLSEVSFITQAITAILQLAVSMDYAIFLMHEFQHQKALIDDEDEALKKAIKISASAIVSSALTTIFGFLALMFMRFGLGKDLGLVLAKGIVFSLISVILFLPALIKLSMKAIIKTKHKDFLPNFKPVSKFLVRFRRIILVILLIAPIAFVGQSRNAFTYGMGQYQAGTKESVDEKFIQDTFGQNLKVVVLVPRGDLVKEDKMINELKASPYVTYIQSYTEQVGKEIPTEVTPSYAISSLLSENYSRIILNTNTDSEGKVTFEFVKYLNETISKYYTDYELIGESVSMEEMSRIIQKDNKVVNLLAIVSIALVILINFKSLLLPLILVFTIETSIWINLSIPYFTSTNLSFIGYLVISSIQLGATVDYAILYTNNYLEFRKTMGKKEALIETGGKVYGSLMAPALILTVAGILLSIISSITLVSELGTVLGRGAFLSFILVVVLLPALLYLFDGLIEKTMYKPNFKKE